MGLNKNLSIEVPNCKSCEQIATMTLSPTLITDRESSYNIHSHDSNDGYDSEEVDNKISKAIQDAVSSANAYTNEKLKAASNNTDRLYEKIKYEIFNTPEGCLVDYGEREIRVMCPDDTKWVKQNVGSTGNANMYYMGFKAYAPEDAVSFKEGDQGTIIDEMFTFDGDFAGTDEFGRNYSVCWLALASYDEASGTWTYFGKNSTDDHYIGWTYVVEWYNSDGVVIESDSIRINLSNEECHSSIKPSYTNDVVEEAVNAAKEYTDEQVANIISDFEVSDEDIESLFPET